jgi:predicted Fe-Mo cluster-binding NifX family protein
MYIFKNLGVSMMKIALPSRNGHIDDHFGHCDHFTVYTVDMEEKSILDSQVVESPNGCGCKSNIATTLSDLGVKIMLAGNMGNGAVNKLKISGIDVVRGCSGLLETVAQEWLKGNIQDSSISCISHDCNH